MKDCNIILYRKERVQSEILDTLESAVTHYFDRHARMFSVLLTLTYPQETDTSPGNEAFSGFLDSLKKWFHRHGRGLDPAYVWVRERKTSACHHYHLLLLLNGHRKQNGWDIVTQARNLWNGRCGGSVHCSKGDGGGGMMFHRGSPGEIGRFLGHTRYLAKAATKYDDTRPPQGHSFGCSRLA